MEHIVVTSDPGGEYLFHFTPAEATDQIKAAEQTAIKLFDWIEMYGVDETLNSIGGDSTNANTGCYGGTFTLLEKKLGRKLMWLVCFLHTNELPLRHLIEDLGGKTTSDHTFSGPLGETLADAVNLEVNPRFLPIKTGQSLVGLDKDVINDLSSDQKYGYQMVVAIRTGKVPTDLAKYGNWTILPFSLAYNS